MEVRLIQPDEFEELAEITLRANRELFGGPLGPYEERLADVAGRALDSEVYVARDDDALLGGICYVEGPGRAMSEFTDPEAAGVRMLAVDPRRRGEGAGRALVATCVARARAQGRRRIILHSAPQMTTAQFLYREVGFARRPDLDEWVISDHGDAGNSIHLMGFVLEL